MVDGDRATEAEAIARKCLTEPSRREKVAVPNL